MTVTDLQIKASYFGFTVTMFPSNKYQVLRKGRGLGFKGSLLECLAYLDGWRDRCSEKDEA